MSETVVLGESIAGAGMITLSLPMEKGHPIHLSKDHFRQYDGHIICYTLVSLKYGRKMAMKGKHHTNTNKLSV